MEHVSLWQAHIGHSIVLVRDQGHCYAPYVGLFVELET